jgi:hypothetical protein
MRKRISTWKLSPGLLELGLARRSSSFRAGSHSATHSAWAARIANRLSVRPATRDFARARLVSLALRDVIRHDNSMQTLVTHFALPQWVSNAFTNVVLQQLFVARPMVWRVTGELPQPATVASNAGQSGITTQTPTVRPAAFLSLDRRRGGVVTHKSQSEKGVARSSATVWPRMKRSISSRRADVQGERLETAVTMITRRYQRVEVKRERPATKVISAGQTENAQRAAFPDGSSSFASTHFSAPSRSLADAGGPIRALQVTQVADEVMKQLDRRLVTARERMGKI